ncbi:MAG: Transcription repressor of multidrug efflux pump acrAB operon, TetR (AcrR) family [Rhizobium sp.]|nr:Transcription repressor of multidrug efflux pump acrAB operon, TetR (AcrR) family [Rhizobium sp.]
MRRTKAEAEETRQRIICAAERVFYDKGVSETTLEDVAREAGVTRGAIYWHFVNKTELLLALHDSVPLPQEDMVARELQADPGDALALMLKASVDWLAAISGDERRQRIYTILFRCDYSQDMAGLLEKQRDMDSLSCTSVCHAFETAQTKGQLASGWTPYAASRCFIWMLKGLYIDWLRFGMKFDLAAEGEKCLSQLFASFRSKRPQA